LQLRSRSAEETRGLAQRLGRAIEAAAETQSVGFVIGLVGPLGAGKTEWVRGLAAGLGIEPDLVTSPTFVIASEYPGRRLLVHADCYRLESGAELEAAGFWDWLEPGHVVAVEWIDRFPGVLPPDHLSVRLACDADDPEARDVFLDPTGPVAKRVLAQFVKISPC
jgi:tRNA threonylcarbamoyladenosine biosynthesis protein TsaE